jgi:DNA-3-methyladenine glycosylase I
MNDPGIVRNRAKIDACISNAIAYLEIEAQQGFAPYLWNFVDGKPVQNTFRSMGEIPAETPLARTISKDLKQRGFKFVGPTIVYAFMQAVGMVNDHVVTCYRHGAVKRLATRRR